MSTRISGRVQGLVVEGYRSIRSIDVSFEDVNVITGPNGCGKSNLFNALKLARAAMQGRLARTIAEEGGMEATLWAGKRLPGNPRLVLDLQCEPFRYTLEIGNRPFSEKPLYLDPQIKSETIKVGGQLLVERQSATASVRDIEGVRVPFYDLLDTESIVVQVADPDRFPALFQLSRAITKWIFYHDFRTDPESPLRRPGLATYTPRLDDDGGNLGPCLYVTYHQGESARLKEILGSAFPGSRFHFLPTTVEMKSAQVDRTFSIKELSDGTVKFLAIAAACFSKQHAPLLAFNEPENSLSDAALEPLADLLAHAAQFSQLWITTHSEVLARALENRTACKPIRLTKVDGETTRSGIPSSRGWRSEDYE